MLESCCEYIPCSNFSTATNCVILGCFISKSLGLLIYKKKSVYQMDSDFQFSFNIPYF